MAFINRFILIIYVLCFGACSPQNKTPISLPISSQIEIEDSVLDSLGELAYDHFPSFEKDPDGFLMSLPEASLKPHQREAYLWILINMGYGFQQNSQILQSASFYEKAWRFDNEFELLEKSDKLTFIYKPLANNYTILSDYTKSERLQLQAFEEAKTNLDKASFSNNLAILYTHNGQLPQAKFYGHKGLELAGDSLHLQVLLHNALSQVYYNIESFDQLDSAKIHNQLALNKSIFAKDSWMASARISALNQAANLELMSKNTEYAPSLRSLSSAENYLNASLQLENSYFKNSRYREKAVIYNKLGEIYYFRKDVDRAIQSFKQALSFYDRENLKEYTSTYTQVLILKNLGFAFEDRNIDSAWQYLKMAVEADFSFQQGVTSSESHLHNNQLNRKLLEEIYAFANRQFSLEPRDGTTSEELFASVSSSQSHAFLLWMTELTKGRLLWNSINRSSYWASDQNDENMQLALQDLKRLYTDRDRATDASKKEQIELNIQEVLANFELSEHYFSRNLPLPNYEEFLNRLNQKDILQYAYYIHQNGNLSIFRVFNGEVGYYYLKGDDWLGKIAEFKETYFSQSPHAFNSNPMAYQEKSIELKNQLLPDLPIGKKDQFSPIRIQLSLDNELFSIPFEALKNENQYLVENFDFQYVHTFVLENKHVYTSQDIQVLYREEYEPPLSNLKFVKKEVGEISKQFKTNILPPGSNNLDRLEDAFQQSGVVHIAAHALLNEENDAYLLLDNPISTDQLTYYNIQAPLVVLSACNTASGELLLSEGLESINRAFLSKGVGGVIATHWFANDDVMLDLTQKFYRSMSENKSPIKALGHAKREFLKEQDEIGRNPWYWANMAYTGSDIQIDLPVKAGLLRLEIVKWFFAIPLIAVFCVIYWKKRKRSVK